MPKSQDKYDKSSSHDKSRRSGREKAKDKIVKDGYDWYAILGFSEKDPNERAKISSKQISMALNKQLNKYHPDRVGNVTPEQTKQFNAIFRLVQQAGAVLTNKNKRKAYDVEQSVQKSSDFGSHKSKFEEFKELQEKNNTDESKHRAKLDFERGLSDLNKKHGTDKYSTTAISKDDANRKMEDLIHLRQIEHNEIKPARIFNEGEGFNRDTFMRAFAKDQMRRSKKRETGDGVLPYDQIGAFNDLNPTFGVNDDYGGLYSQDRFGGDNKFGKFSGSESDSDNSIDSDELDDNYVKRYVSDGKTDNTDVKAALDVLLSTRDKEDNIYKTMDLNEFKSSMDDKFGISSSMGFMVGNKEGDQVQRKLRKQLKNNEVDAYMKMIGGEDSSDDDSYAIDS